MAEQHDDGEALTAAEREALAAWTAAAPPAGFAERVLAAQAASPVTAPTVPSSPRSPWAGRRVTVASAVVAGACLAALGVAVVRTRAAGPAATGEVEVATRRTLAVGARATAVAEAGASLAWRVDARGADVTQRAGDVFYRVAPGGPFVVHTPAGDVRVTGSCFRIEVPEGAEEDQMTTKKMAVIGGAVGAVLAAAVVVSVYEGGVVVASAGASRAAAAGDRVIIGADGVPVLDTGSTAAATVSLAGLTRDQLLAAHTAQRAQLANLAAEVARLRGPGGAGSGGPDGERVITAGRDDGDGQPWFDPSPQTLQAMAKDCRVRFDLPQIMESEPPNISPRAAEKFGLTPEELPRVNAALAALHTAWMTKVRALYAEATGDTTGADSLSVEAMAQEITDKSPPGETDALRRRMAEERAGLVAPPADLSKTTPVERYFRGLGGLGAETEQALAGVVGPERARELRAADRGLFGQRMEMAGCPEGEGEEQAREGAR